MSSIRVNNKHGYNIKRMYARKRDSYFSLTLYLILYQITRFNIINIPQLLFTTRNYILRFEHFS